MIPRTRTLHRAAWLASLLAGTGAGCAGKAPPPPKPVAILPVADAPAAPFVTPAHWDYHPSEPYDAIASLELPNSGCVITADDGQRWVSTPEPKSAAKDGAQRDATREEEDADDDAIVCAGKADTSIHLAPENLISIIRRADNAWLFIGASGKLFEASDPLGAFTRVVEPPEPLSHVAAAGQFVLGTTRLGKLMRWDEARGWRPAQTAPTARLFDVAVTSDGHALGLSFPEALFTSTDGGLTWAAASAPKVGARRVGVSRDKSLLAEGIFEAVKWNPKAQTPFAGVREGLPAVGASLDLLKRRAPQAAAVTSGRAVLEGDRYYEVLRPEETESEQWTLARGHIEGRLETLPIPWAEDCGSIRIGARGKYVYLACVAMSGDDIKAELRRSEDQGSTWSAPLTLTTADTNDVRIAVSSEGAALITGVCKNAEGPDGCKPGSPVLVRHNGKALEATLAGAPQLSELPLLPAFSYDGKSAYFLGRRGKDSRLTLFVSHDAGKTFSQRALEETETKPPRRPIGDDEDYDEPSEPDDYIEVDESCSLRPGEDGTVGMLVIRSRGYSYITADEDGRVLQSTWPPNDDSVMAGAGRHLISISYGNGSGDSAPFTLYESQDGGLTWDPQSASSSFVRDWAMNSGPIVCSLAGCLIGDNVTRVGWGGQPEPLPFEAPDDSATSRAPAVLTPIRCELSAQSKWTRIANPYGVSASRAPIPDVDEIMRGRSAWSMMSFDPKTGAASVVSATLPESGEGDARVATRSLLGPRPRKDRSALALSFQMEGYAAIRAAIPTNKDGRFKIGAPLGKLEVAWENFMEGTAARGTIPDGGTLDASDIAPGNGDLRLETGLVSVTVRGIFVRPHGARAVTQRGVFFLDPKGKVERMELPTWASRGLGGHLDVRTDAAAIDGHPLGVGLVHDSSGNTVSLLLSGRVEGTVGDKPTTQWSTNALSLAPANDTSGSLRSRSDWTYSGKSSIGITTLTADPSHGEAWATFHAFRGDGTFAPPQPVSTLRDLGDRPKPCSAADRAGSPRVKSMLMWRNDVLFPGMRHPVLVTEPPSKNAVGVSEPIVLLTGAAVTHGAPGSPCVAGWEAEGLRRSPVGAVILGDLNRAWLFRVVTSADPSAAEASSTRRPPPKEITGIEYRAMSCRFDPSAPIPETVFNEPGTIRIER